MNKIVKNILFIGILCVLFGFSLIHMYIQYKVLTNATKLNSSYFTNINELDLENKIMRQKIEYATSSSFFNNKIRSELSLGNMNDYKIIINNNLKDLDLYTKDKTEQVKTIKKWFKLFTQ